MVLPPDLNGIRALGAIVAAQATRGIADPREEGFARLAQFATAGPVQARLSETGQLIDGVMRFVQASDQPASLTSRALLPAPAPGLPVQAPALADAIRTSLSGSGLFYEAHLAQWVEGARPLATLMQEPQAKFAHLSVPDRAAAAGGSADDKAPLPAPANPLEVAPQDAARAAWLVSLQLDALEHRRAAWQGELWPGQPMRWDIRDEQPRDGGGKDGSDVARGWVSTIELRLPALGTLKATLNLQAGDRVRILLQPGDAASAERLKAAGSALAGALAAAGTTLDQLIVQPGTAA